MFENELNPVLEGVRFLRELLGNGGQADSAASGSGWSVEVESIDRETELEFSC